MKKLFLAALLLLATFGLYSFQQLQKKYDNIFNQLGLGTEEAESYISGNILGSSSSFPRTKVMAQLALNRRKEVVKEIGDYIKSYVKTAAFANEYDMIRKEMKPVPPPNTSDKDDMKWYREELANWEKNYPASIDVLVRKRLSDFLQLTDAIHYDAKLERRGNKMVFVDPELEAKDEFWKGCFRSGKTTVDAARAYAQQWLAALK
jgi:hypothetical protein